MKLWRYIGFGLLLLVAAVGLGAQSAMPDGPVAGRNVADVLQQLSDNGLRIVFTDLLVPANLIVESEPTRQEIPAWLEELLAPHGLTVRPGPADSWMVVAASADDATPARWQLRGRIVLRDSGQPLPGVSVRVEGISGDGTSGDGTSGDGTSGDDIASEATASDEDGRFVLTGLTPGNLEIVCQKDGHLPRRVAVQLDSGTSLATDTLEIAMMPMPTTLEEIDVTTSRWSLLGDQPSTLVLDREKALALPHFGDDLLRTLALLPGTSSNDLSSRFNVRGGNADEVLVRLDGLELLEAYHLKDFGGLLSILPPKVIEGIELITGGFPADYGDRMGGVLDLTTVSPAEHRSEIALSLLNLQLGSSGKWRNGSWMSHLRGGTLEPALRLVDRVENPRFWDGFGKLQLQPRATDSLHLQTLISYDILGFGDPTEGLQEFRTDYRLTYLWGHWHRVGGNNTFFELRGSHSDIQRERRALQEPLLGSDQSNRFDLRDDRKLAESGLYASWNRYFSRHQVRAGADLRATRMRYDYRNSRQLENVLALIRNQPRNGVTRFQEAFRGTRGSAFFADRWRLGSTLEFEAGLRFDRSALTDEELWSPRLNLVASIGDRGTLRAAWGHFYQSQRPYELQVEDGETNFARAERAEHRILGYEHLFNRPNSGRRLLAFRAELYQRPIRYPRPRWENLFESISIVPELESDRVLFAPTSARAEGFEFFVRGDAGSKADWWISYSASRIRDRFDLIDRRDVPRRIDQPHSLQANIGFRVPWQLDVQLALLAHSGWPTTEISATAEIIDQGAGGNNVDTSHDRQIVPVLGPLRDQRFDTYSRLDLRVSRRFVRQQGEWQVFVEVQNLFNQRNVAGYDIDFQLTPLGDAVVLLDEQTWAGILPMIGASWSW